MGLLRSGVLHELFAASAGAHLLRRIGRADCRSLSIQLRAHGGLVRVLYQGLSSETRPVRLAKDKTAGPAAAFSRLS